MDNMTTDLTALIAEIENTDAYRAIPEERQPWYNEHGDSIMFIDSDEEIVARRVDSYLTLYHSFIDNRLIGFKLKDIKALVKSLDCDYAHVAGEISRDSGDGIKIHWLLFRACKDVDTQHLSLLDAYREAVVISPKDWSLPKEMAA